MHFEEKKRRPLPMVVREIDGLGLQIRQDGLDGRAERAGLRSSIPGFDRDIHFDKESHKSPPYELWIVAISDVLSPDPARPAHECGLPLPRSPDCRGLPPLHAPSDRLESIWGSGLVYFFHKEPSLLVQDKATRWGCTYRPHIVAVWSGDDPPRMPPCRHIRDNLH